MNEELIFFLQKASNNFIEKAKDKLKIKIDPVLIQYEDFEFENACYNQLPSSISFTSGLLNSATQAELLFILGHELGHYIDSIISGTLKNSIGHEFLADELSVVLFDVPAAYGISYFIRQSFNDECFMEDSDSHPCTCERITRLLELVKKDRKYSNCANDVLYYNILTGGDDYEHTSRVSKQVK